jgi:sugar phosphate isomerase/epimerase
MLTALASGPIWSAFPNQKDAQDFDKKSVPVGLEMYSVRHEMQKDMSATLTAVAKMGYSGVEFFAPYYDWTPDYAKQIRSQLDELKIWCKSTHNGPKSFNADGWDKAVELNKILGTKYIVMSSPGKVSTGDDWKHVAETLDAAQDRFRKDGLNAGYHNHDVEWKPLADGTRPMDILANNTGKNVMLQLDVGTCVEAGGDPVQWINDHAGRIRSMHVKEWSKAKGYRVLLNEGDAS